MDTGNDNFANDKQFELIKKGYRGCKGIHSNRKTGTSLEQLLLHPRDFFLYPQHRQSGTPFSVLPSKYSVSMSSF